MAVAPFAWGVVSVTAPQGNMGDITGGLSSKRGRVNGTDALPGGMVCVSGQVPLSELGLETSAGMSITFLISTTQDPWISNTAEGNFIPKVVEALRNTVIECVDIVKQKNPGAR